MVEFGRRAALPHQPVIHLRVRHREFETLHKLGCSRGTVWRLQLTELSVVVGTGVFVALASPHFALLPTATRFVSSTSGYSRGPDRTAGGANSPATGTTAHLRATLVLNEDTC